MMDTMQQIFAVMEELEEDQTVSRNVKIKVAAMKEELKLCGENERSLKVNKILSELEEISNDINLPAFVRTQIWHLTSMLETVC